MVKKIIIMLLFLTSTQGWAGTHEMVYQRKEIQRLHRHMNILWQPVADILEELDCLVIHDIPHKIKHHALYATTRSIQTMLQSAHTLTIALKNFLVNASHELSVDNSLIMGVVHKSLFNQMQETADILNDMSDHIDTLLEKAKSFMASVSLSKSFSLIKQHDRSTAQLIRMIVRSKLGITLYDYLEDSLMLMQEACIQMQEIKRKEPENIFEYPPSHR